MKKIIAAILLTSTLSGCTAIATVKQIWPRDHDPALVAGFVNLEVALEGIDCNNGHSLINPLEKAEWLNRYAEFRNDPQKVSTKAIIENLSKAQGASEVTCQRWVNLSKVRMKIIREAWAGR